MRLRRAAGVGVAGPLALLLAFWWLSLRHLEAAPPVYEDEPWQASTGWKLAAQGTFGSDMFAGLNGMEARYYGYPPLHPLLLAGTFRLLGLGLWQTRLEPVIMGLLGLALTYAWGRRLFGRGVGLLAGVLLLGVRTSGLTPYQLTGIVWMDFTRIGRYDMVVPVFGLAALHAWRTGRRPGARPEWWLAGAGLLAGLAGLAHLYGVFWLPALAALTVAEARDGQVFHARRLVLLAALGAGFAVAWLPYVFYVAGGWPDFVAQTAGYADRFQLADPAWYWLNLAHEYRRYGPGLGPDMAGTVLRPGFWLAALGVPAALAALARGAKQRGDRAALHLALPAMLLPVLFGLFIHSKVANYLVAFWPLFAVAAAWGLARLWQRRGGVRPLLRAAVLLGCLAVFVEGAGQLWRREQLARALTPFDEYIGRVRLALPPGGPATRVLGLHNYWLGFADRDYRSWLAPIALADATPSLPLASVLDSLAPEVVLVDDTMRAYFAEASEGGALGGQAAAWLVEHYALAARIEDDTYGAMEIYLPRRPP